MNVFDTIKVVNMEDGKFARETDTIGFLRFLTNVVLNKWDDLRVVSFDKKLTEINWFTDQENDLRDFVIRYRSIYLVSDNFNSGLELKFGEPYGEDFLTIKYFRNEKMLNQVNDYKKSWGVFKLEPVILDIESLFI